MRVSELRQILSHYDANDEIAVVWYDKGDFEIDLDQNLSDKSWELICEEFTLDEHIDRVNRNFLQSRSYDLQEDLECGGCFRTPCTCDYDPEK
jgi:hypothetical protein